MSLARFTAILRTRYETGAYGDAVFRMATSTAGTLKTQFPPASTSAYAAVARPLEGLLGIPMLIDEDVPDGTWQLAVPGQSRSHWLVIESGTIEAGELPMAPVRRVRCRHGQSWKRNPDIRSADEWLGDPYEPGLRASTAALVRDHGPLEPLP